MHKVWLDWFAKRTVERRQFKSLSFVPGGESRFALSDAGSGKATKAGGVKGVERRGEFFKGRAAGSHVQTNW